LAKKKARRKPSCHFCGEDERHLRRFEVRLDGKREYDWRLCRSCAAVLTVLLRDKRNHH
jgi:transposase-like protein